MAAEREEVGRYRQLTCIRCSEAFATLSGRRGPVPKYCGTGCRRSVQRSNEKARHHARLLERDQRAACIDCGRIFFRPAVNIGRRRIRCTFCSPPAFERVPGVPRRRHSIKCEECHTQFESIQRWAKFCSKRCADRNRRRTRLATVSCANCFRTVSRFINHEDIGKFCGRGCAYAHKTRVCNEIRALQRIGEAQRNERKEKARQAKLARQEAMKLAREEQRRASLQTTCHTCGLNFTKEGAHRGPFCSTSCHRKAPHVQAARRKARVRVNRRDREALGNRYVAKLLSKHIGLPASAVPIDFIEAKRTQLKLQRFIKEKRK